MNSFTVGEEAVVVTIKIGMNPANLASLIRFHLSELGARNAHHEFEHLARHVARARIASNIVPATGPVSGGGDRGRDFETFNTKHVAPGLPGNHFAERSTGARKLVFACSLQKTIVAKIRKDLRSLVAQEGIEEVAYFCESSLPIASRLKLIDEAKENGISLQVFDGNAISEWLAEPDIFWIAQEYLHLPSEIAPAGELEHGYIEHKQLWQSRRPIPVSRSDFSAIKMGLRKATFDDSARSDLHFWLEKMSAFLTSPAPRNLARDAMYEVAVATLRGKGNLTPVAHLVADYFSDVSQHTSVGDFTDAVVLLTYCFGAYWLEQYSVNVDELFARRRVLSDLFDRWLAEPGIGPGRRSGLLRMRGALEFTPAEPGLVPDLTRVFELWNAMLDCAAEAPLYPIDEFSDHLTRMMSYMEEFDPLLALSSRADELLARRAGSAAAGEKAIDRAISLLDRGEVVAAIRELHKAKAKWFSAEQLGGMLQILLLLAEQYGRLGLAYASKYYSMAAAFVACYEDPERLGVMLPKALLDVAEAEDAAGNSLGFFQLIPVILAAHVEHDPQPLDMGEHPRIRESFAQLAALLGLLKRGNAQAREHLDTLFAGWPSEIKDPIRNMADEPGGFWNQRSWEETWTDLEEAMIDRPFGDLGATRKVSWSALGIDWLCEFTNDYVTTPRAEQVIAELQVAACAVAGRDIGIIPCSVAIKIDCKAELEKLEVVFPEGGASEITVSLPIRARGAEDSVDSAALFAGILSCCSVLDEDALKTIFDESVLENIFVARPYSELYCEFVPLELFAQEIRKASIFEPGRRFVSRAGKRIPWFDGLGPTYDEEMARVDIEHRYRRIGVFLAHTLDRVRADEALMARLRELHDKGMKDWEILGILSNIALNHRLTFEGDLTPGQWRDLALQLMDRPEEPKDALDPAIFSTEQFKPSAAMYLAAFLAGRGLRAPLLLPPEGLEKFLIARYRIREDDVAHSDFFGWSSSGNS